MGIATEIMLDLSRLFTNGTVEDRHGRRTGDLIDKILTFHTEKQKFAVRQISYSEIALKPLSNGSLPRSVDTSIPGELEFAGEKVPVAIKPIAGKASAFSLIHRSSESLIFLRQILEPVRAGRSLVIHDYKSPSGLNKTQTVLSGPGPTNLTLSLHPGGDINYCRVTFPTHDRYLELRFQNGSFETKTCILHAGATIGLTYPTSMIDFDILKQAGFLLLGIQDQRIFKLILPILERIYDFLIPIAGTSSVEQKPA